MAAAAADTWESLVAMDWPMEPGDLGAARVYLARTHADFLRNRAPFPWSDRGVPIGTYQQSVFIEKACALLGAELCRLEDDAGALVQRLDVALACSIWRQLALVEWYAVRHYGRAFVHENLPGTKGAGAALFARMQNVIYLWALVRERWYYLDAALAAEFARLEGPHANPAPLSAKHLIETWAIIPCGHVDHAQWTASDCVDILGACTARLDGVHWHETAAEATEWRRFLRVLELRCAYLAMHEGTPETYGTDVGITWRREADGAVVCVPTPAWVRDTGVSLCYLKHQVAIRLFLATREMKESEECTSQVDALCDNFARWVQERSSVEKLGTENDTWKFVQNAICDFAVTQPDYVRMVWHASTAPAPVGVLHSEGVEVPAHADAGEARGVAPRWQNNRCVVPPMWAARAWRKALNILWPLEGGQYLYVDCLSRASLRDMAVWLDPQDSGVLKSSACFGVLLDLMFAASPAMHASWSEMFLVPPAQMSAAAIEQRMSAIVEDVHVLLRTDGTERRPGAQCAYVVCVGGGSEFGVICALPAAFAMIHGARLGVRECSDAALQHTRTRAADFYAVFVSCGRHFTRAIVLWALMILCYGQLGWQLTTEEQVVRTLMRDVLRPARA